MIVLRRASPLLVTGLPRSGTTWLARRLAEAPGTSMLGREPMNPRAGQWALAGEAAQWSRWEQAPPRARRILARTYRGRAPRTYGRLGVRQWRAPLPGTRLVVKDPFALLSLPAVVEATGAVPVVVYRSPDALLASYRRMGWRPDLAEMLSLGADVPPGADTDDVQGMACFWSYAHRCLLDDLERVPSAVVVSHDELTRGGDPAQRALLERLGLPATPTRAVKDEQGRVRVQEDRLHNLDRTPEEVLAGSRHRVSPEERQELLSLCADVAAELGAARWVWGD